MRKIVVHNHFPAQDGGPGSGPPPAAKSQTFYEKGDPRKPPTEAEKRLLGLSPKRQGIDPEKLKQALANREATNKLLGRDAVALAERGYKTLHAQVATMARLEGDPEPPANTPRAKLGELYRKYSKRASRDRPSTGR